MASSLRPTRALTRVPSTGSRQAACTFVAIPLRGILFAALVAAILLAGCNENRGAYAAASSISSKGFARNPKAVRGISGERVKLWGFVDHGNVFADQQRWTGPESRRPGEPAGRWWRFNLKAEADDATGHSFAVLVPADEGRDALLRAFLNDAEAQRPTRVFVTGRLFTFDAPLNRATRTGLYVELESSADVLLAEPRPAH